MFSFSFAVENAKPFSFTGKRFIQDKKYIKQSKRIIHEERKMFEQHIHTHTHTQLRDREVVIALF